MQALAISDLVKIYPSGLMALKNIHLNVEEGDFFALLGPNGAGKSTTIGIVSSLVNKTSGQIKIFGHDLEQDRVVAKSYLGLVPQELNFNQFERVLDIVVNQAGFYGLSRKIALIRAEKYLAQLGLWEKRLEMARTLSGGMKRRLMIARALIHEPKMLILDEPTAGVDIELRRSTWQFLQDLNEQGTTIILTTHYLEEAEYLCRGIAIINHGKILADTTVKKLLGQLQTETLVLDLQEPIEEIPTIDGYSFVKRDQSTLEVTFCKKNNINQLFATLTQCGLKIESLRNKANRLEELFIGLIQDKKHGH